MVNCRAFLFIFIVFFVGFAWAQSFCINKDGVKLKEAPNSKAKTTWQVPKYMPLQGTGNVSGSYFEVADLDGVIHWVLKKDVSRKMSCLVVKSKSTKLRTGPGVKYPVSPAGVVDKYAAYKDLGGEDGWTEIEDDLGTKSWINLDRTWKATSKMRMSFDGE